MGQSLPPIPVKRYFTIGEVGELCKVKPHVLRYWEQEFIQLRPMKRQGNRRYYQRHEVLMIRRIRDLLYEQGFTIGGARNKLEEWADMRHVSQRPNELGQENALPAGLEVWAEGEPRTVPLLNSLEVSSLRIELVEIRRLLSN